MLLIPTVIDYTITKQAQVVLAHLRAEYSITEEQAKTLYNIDNLVNVIDELLAAGHVIFQIFVVSKEPPVKAYTLCEFKEHDPKKLKQLTKTKQRLFSNAPVFRRAS